MRYAAKVDGTQKALVAVAKQFGAKYHHIGGVIDGLLLYNGRLLAVDWKSPGGTLTPEQAKLVAAGWPILFISDEQQLIQALRSEAHHG